MSETLSLTDTVSSTAEVLLSETISFTDTVSRAGATTVSLSETLQLSDNPSVPTNLVALDAEGFGGEYVETFTLTGTYAGTYAIVTAGSDDAVQIIDISNPTNSGTIIPKDSATDDADGFTVLDGPSGVDTFTVASNSTATYAIVLTSGPEDGIQMIDVSNPTAIVALDAETDGNNGFDIMDGPGDVDVFTIGTSTVSYTHLRAHET